MPVLRWVPLSLHPPPLAARGRHSPIYSFFSPAPLPTSSGVPWTSREGRIRIFMSSPRGGVISVGTAQPAVMRRHDADLDHEAALEPPVPAPLGRAPDTRNASSHVACRPGSLASSASCYSPRQSRVALPRSGGTFSPPAPPPPFAPPPPNASSAFAAERSSRAYTLSSADNPNHAATGSLSSVAARYSGKSPSNHNPEPPPLSTSARPESLVSGSSRYSDLSGLDQRYVCFLPAGETGGMF